MDAQKMYRRTVRTTYALITALALAACSQQSQAPSSAPSTPETINASLEHMAKLFARAVTDSHVRQHIQQQVAQRFDGDSNVLYKTLVTAELQAQSGVDIRKALANAYIQSGELSSQSEGQALAVIEDLAANIPRFQVAVPEKFDTWDAGSYTPLVGYVPAGGDDAALKEIKAFDSMGKEHTLDASVSPAQPVIILSQNERTDETGTVLSTLSGDRKPDSDTDLAPQACVKNVFMEKVELHYDHEPWTKGDPEIMLIVASTKPGLFYHGGLRNVNAENVGYFFHLRVGCTSTDVIYYWYEDDGSGLDITASYRGFSLGVKLDDGDDFMGAVQVAYKHLNGIPSWWELGSLKFSSN